ILARKADDARPDVSGAVNAADKARHRAQLLRLAVEADIVDGRTCRAGKISRCTDDARNSQKNIIGLRSRLTAGESDSAGEDAVPLKADVEPGRIENEGAKAPLARSGGYEISIISRHWLLLRLQRRTSLASI